MPSGPLTSQWASTLPCTSLQITLPLPTPGKFPGHRPLWIQGRLAWTRSPLISWWAINWSRTSNIRRCIIRCWAMPQWKTIRSRRWESRSLKRPAWRCVAEIHTQHLPPLTKLRMATVPRQKGVWLNFVLTTPLSSLLRTTIGTTASRALTSPRNISSRWARTITTVRGVRWMSSQRSIRSNWMI